MYRISFYFIIIYYIFFQLVVIFDFPNLIYIIFMIEDYKSNRTKKYSFLTFKNKQNKWTKEEDNKLLDVSLQFQGKKWKEVSRFFENKTPIQCFQRWKEVIRPGVIKGEWTKEEDLKIIEIMTKYNESLELFRGKEIIPGRTLKQCRERWKNVLNPNLNKDIFTIEEQYLLFKLYSVFNGRWSYFSSIFPSIRSDNYLKNKFYSTIRRKRREIKNYLSTETIVENLLKDLKENIVLTYQITNEVEFETFVKSLSGLVLYQEIESRELNKSTYEFIQNLNKSSTDTITNLHIDLISISNSNSNLNDETVDSEKEPKQKRIKNLFSTTTSLTLNREEEKYNPEIDVEDEDSSYEFVNNKICMFDINQYFD